MVRKYNSISRGLIASMATVLCVYTGSARAADDTSDRLDEVVVTATKRATTVQTTPVALSALDSAALEKNNITDLTRLPLQVPSMYVGGEDGFGSTSVSIRGIGSLAIGVGADEGVGVYVDGVYQGKPYGNVFEFVDIDRVEVLRGPQGTLYGRNATGGAINIVTKQPGDEATGQVNAEYTNYQGVRVSGYALIPLISNELSLKVAAGSNKRDGWGYDPVRNDHPYNVDNQYGSVALRWRPATGTDITLSGRIGQSYSSVQFKDANDKSLPSDVFPDDYPAFENRKYSAATLTASQDLGFASLVSITGYEEGHSINSQDSDLTPNYYFEFNSDQRSSQFSEELRLVSQGDSRFSWIAGFLYFREGASVFLPFQITIADTGVLFDAHLKTSSYSGFAEGTYKITDQLSVTAGGRYNYDDKHWNGCVAMFDPAMLATPSLCDGSATQPDSRSWGSFTPRFVLNYQITKDLLTYLSATRGFRSGGWNFTDATSFHSGFNPENIWSYEGGLKSESFDHRLRVNLAAFYAKYTDLQVRINDGPFLATRNAGAARNYGAELETDMRLIDHLDLTVNASWLNAKYTSFSTTSDGVTQDYAGRFLNRAPEFTATVAAQYAIEAAGVGIFTPRAEYRHVAQVFYSQDNVQPQGADAYNEVNLKVRYEPMEGHWNLTAFVNDLTNKQFRTHTFPGNLPGQVASSYSTPRIFGLQGQYTW
jgi:iron complex outermembrane recepter protein